MTDPAQFAATAAARPAAPNTAPKTHGLTSDFETFLQMLTTQMRNQDPLNPMDSAEFALQLASFSSVEQQVRTNQLLEAMAGQSALGELAALIGRQARAPGPALYSGEPVSVAFDLPPEADSGQLIVRNALGNVVETRSIDPDARSIDWVGLGPDGHPLPRGRYSFEVTAFVGEENLGSVRAEPYHRIIEVRLDPSGHRLVLEGGGEIAPDQLRGLRRDAAG